MSVAVLVRIFLTMAGVGEVPPWLSRAASIRSPRRAEMKGADWLVPPTPRSEAAVLAGTRSGERQVEGGDEIDDVAEGVVPPDDSVVMLSSQPAVGVAISLGEEAEVVRPAERR